MHNVVFKKGLETQSITRRLTLSLIMSVLIVSVIAVTALYYVVSDTAKKGLELKADEIVSYLIGSLEGPLWDINASEVSMIGKAISQDEAIVTVAIRDHSGAVVYSREKQHGGELVTRSSKIFHKAEDREIYVGEVSVCLTQSYFQSANRVLLFACTLIIVLILTAIVIVTRILIRTSLRKPLDSLNEIADCFGAGIYDVSGHGLPYLEFQPFGKVLSQMADELQGLIEHLEERVFERTQQLEAAISELESFCYSVSHDLRAPLRGIDGWSAALIEDCGDFLDEQGYRYLERVRAEAQRMDKLIDGLLELSRLGRIGMMHERVDLSAIARAVAQRLLDTEPDRQVEFLIQEGMTDRGDARLLELVIVNLIGNAWKFTCTHPSAKIEVGSKELEGRRAYFVRDDGVGFDMAHAGKLFGTFQRMHGVSEFPGSGVGLATVQRIIQRHGGRAWAEAEVEKGATFYFTLNPDGIP